MLSFDGRPHSGWFTEGRNLAYARDGVMVLRIEWADLQDLVKLANEAWVQGGGKLELLEAADALCKAVDGAAMWLNDDMHEGDCRPYGVVDGCTSTCDYRVVGDALRAYFEARAR